MSAQSPPVPRKRKSTNQNGQRERPKPAWRSGSARYSEKPAQVRCQAANEALMPGLISPNWHCHLFGLVNPKSRPCSRPLDAISNRSIRLVIIQRRHPHKVIHQAMATLALTVSDPRVRLLMTIGNGLDERHGPNAPRSHSTRLTRLFTEAIQKIRIIASVTPLFTASIAAKRGFSSASSTMIDV